MMRTHQPLALRTRQRNLDFYNPMASKIRSKYLKSLPELRLGGAKSTCVAIGCLLSSVRLSQHNHPESWNCRHRGECSWCRLRSVCHVPPPNSLPRFQMRYHQQTTTALWPYLALKVRFIALELSGLISLQEQAYRSAVRAMLGGSPQWTVKLAPIRLMFPLALIVV